MTIVDTVLLVAAIISVALTIIFVLVGLWRALRQHRTAGRLSTTLVATCSIITALLMIYDLVTSIQALTENSPPQAAGF